MTRIFTINSKRTSRILLVTIIVLLGLLIAGSAIYYIFQKRYYNSLPVSIVTEPESTPTPTLLYGIKADSYIIIENKVRVNENLGSILQTYKTQPLVIARIQDSARNVFNVRNIRAGNKYTVFLTRGNTHNLNYLVYEENLVDYVVINLKDSLPIVYRSYKKADTIERSISGVIKTSLWVDMIENGASPELIAQVIDVFAWEIDFFRIKKNDKFKIIYEEVMIGNESIGIGKVKAALFINNDENFYGISFRQNERDDYFDERGNCMRKIFLKVPLKFSRITSSFTYKRFHPLLKLYLPHLAVDYAAPIGTPVHTVGDGVVLAAGYSGGAGNLVKVKHNSVYVSGYNHLSRFAKGIHPGVRVRQGDVIGYVGTTGLSTGPHLDFRIWKNGTNVNPLSLKLPSVESISKESKPAFEKIRNKMISELNHIAFP